ncbi:MAG: glycosyltransferase family 39 protein [Oscillospiraceae bacterium]|nr:glycosyltransferase family 39 protein [Oscillospiraceae bacterium]
MKINKNYNLFFGMIVFAALVLYGLLLVGNDVWYDEAYTFGIIRRGFGDICRITAADVHPPLYYILLKIFAAPFSDKLLISKIFSIIPMLIIMITGGIQLKRIFNKNVSLCFMALFLIFPFMISYSVEIRMYSLAAMFVFLTALYGYKSYEEGRTSDFILFGVFGVSAAYTHYFALVSISIVYLIVLICILKYKRELLRKWIICAVLTIIAYIPWIGCFLRQIAFKVNNEYWIEPITKKTIIEYLRDTFASGDSKVLIYFAELIFAMLFLNVLFSGGRKERNISVCAVIIWAGTILLGVIASFVVRPIFVIRYSIPAIPVFLAFAAVAIANMRPREIQAAAAIIIVISGINNYVKIFEKEREYWDIGFRDEFAESYSYADCYVIADASEKIKAEHYKGVLAYYETEKLIYSYQPVTTAIPFANVVSMRDFKTEENDTVILLKYWNTSIPDEFLENYTYSYKGKVATDSYFSTMDIYELVKKEKS